jgi:hypothetical protein
MNEQVPIWIVGLAKGDNGLEWEFCGAFTDEQVAVSHCTTKRHWVGPELLNRFIGESDAWPGAWFPLLESKP